jgi:cellulose synthase/poly-beta-1,6-N-acetylglucosamine synthase-like glycosyltransferase
MHPITWICLLFLIPATAWMAYLAVLAIAALTTARAPRPLAKDAMRFAILVPAHNEERVIAECVASLRTALEHHHNHGFVCVIADNCTDETADHAAIAGARVLVRQNPHQKSKGYALAYAAQCLLAEDSWEAIMVVDADTIVDKDILSRFEARMNVGAKALQAHYMPRAIRRSWRTDLIRVAWALFNCLRPMGRSALHGTSGIYGNGFALTRETVQLFPFQSHGLVEDAEHALELLTRGVRVEFVPEARVYGLVEADAQTSRSQRIRWESGRFKLASTWIPRLLSGFLRSGRPALLEAAADLATPPLALVAGSILAAALLATVAGAWNLLAIAAILAAAMALLICTAAAVARVPMGTFMSIFYAPLYVSWKLALYASPNFWRQRSWVRTQRPTTEKNP